MLPSHVSLVMGAVPYMVMAASLLRRMQLSDAEKDAALLLLMALKNGGKSPAPFETVLELSHRDFSSGMASLQNKVHTKMGMLVAADLCLVPLVCSASHVCHPNTSNSAFSTQIRHSTICCFVPCLAYITTETALRAVCVRISSTNSILGSFPSFAIRMTA